MSSLVNKKSIRFINTAFTPLVLIIFFTSCSLTARGQHDVFKSRVISAFEATEIARAKAFLLAEPITVTSFRCERSAGGIHDFYSEGDYWWPDPEDPTGPYIKRDGQSNPDNFIAHRKAVMRLSEIVATLTSAWLLTKEQQYADHALTHLHAWFVDSTTRMNPHMLYAQAISGKKTGRSIGLIDAYHLVEVAQSVRLLTETKGIPHEVSQAIKQWFATFLQWMTTHPYGIKEMNARNNHGTCWAVTAASMAVLTENKEAIALCKERFKEILLPKQMNKDGGFPFELRRTKPYIYSIFNLDAFFTLAVLLSDEEDDLFSYSIEEKSLRKGLAFIFPFIQDKPDWPYAQDISDWDQWPSQHPFLLFAAFAFEDLIYLEKYLALKDYPLVFEVRRNLPVRHPILWIHDK